MATDYRKEGRRKYPVKKVPSMTVPDTFYYVAFGVPKDQAKKLRSRRLAPTFYIFPPKRKRINLITDYIVLEGADKTVPIGCTCLSFVYGTFRANCAPKCKHILREEAIIELGDAVPDDFYQTWEMPPECSANGQL